jgi:hypothetical protein
MQHAPKLFPAGPVLWLDAPRAGGGAAVVAPTAFDEIAVVAAMFSEHPATRYLQATRAMRDDGARDDWL